MDPEGRLQDGGDRRRVHPISGTKSTERHEVPWRWPKVFPIGLCVEYLAAAEQAVPGPAPPPPWFMYI